jgi:predicted aspartyl protease
MNQPFFRSAAALTLSACAALSNPSAAAPNPCKYVEVAKLPLQYSGPSLEVTTVGSINGTPATMLVDTGASQTALTRTGTERLGLTLHMTGKYSEGVGGYSRIYEARVSEFSSGIAAPAKGYMRVLSDFAVPPAFDAILGASFLMQADLEISLATKEMKFFRPVDCKDAFLAYWSPDAVVVPFESGSNGRNPYLKVMVNGVKMTAIIDSGAGATSITLRAAKRAGLKLDAPGVTRAGEAHGIGDRKAPRWRTNFDTFQIGDEIVRNAELGVADYDLGEVDMLIGDDFLRSHRVLFAMSQKKVYLSYLGGEPFGQRRTLEPWIVSEADGGNADAQMSLAGLYLSGRLVEKDTARGTALMEKAAAGGNAYANISTGRGMMARGQFADAAVRLRAGLDKLPSHYNAALWLYLARLRTGQAELAATELKANFARNDDEWPGPIADFYLGKINAEALLKEAADERAAARTRTCQALAAMAEWHGARGEKEQSTALAARIKLECAAPQPRPAPAVNAAVAAAPGA